MGAVCKGYHSDLTRTIFVGNDSLSLEGIYDIVLTAQHLAEREARSGMAGGEMDSLARSIITKAGYGERFGHGLGHGVGLDVPIKYYSVTYLFKEKTKTFLRGWHSIMKDAFYLSNVFLEHTYDNGMWIKNHDNVLLEKVMENKENLDK